MKKQITITLSTATLLLGTFGLNAHATPAATSSPLHVAQTTATASFSDQELIAYAQASQKVNEITAQYAPKIQEADSEAEQRILLQQADQDMVRAVRSTDLSVEQFNAITTAVQADPALIEKISKLVN